MMQQQKASIKKIDFSKPFAAKKGGDDPVQRMGTLTIMCGVCPCTIALTFLGLYSGLHNVASDYNSYT